MTKLASSRPWACIVNDKNGINKNARLTDIINKLSLGLSKLDEGNNFALLVMKPSHPQRMKRLAPRNRGDARVQQKDRE